MSDRAKRVLGALIEHDDTNGIGYPMAAIGYFLNNANSSAINEDYQALTIEEEKQVIQAFLEIAY